MRYVLSFGILLALSGCNGYREVPLQEHVVDIGKSHTEAVTSAKVELNGVIDETTAIRLAASFNPELRIPIIRDRGWGEKEVQLRGIVRPELDVSQDDATLYLTTDVLSLYSLLSHGERVAWRAMRKAESDQAYADQHGAVIRLTRDVRLSFLELARLNRIYLSINKQLAYLSRYQFHGNLSKSDALILSLAITECKQKSEDNNFALRNAQLGITRLLGFSPNSEIMFDVNGVLDITRMPELRVVTEMSEIAERNNWQLIGLSSVYIRKEYELRMTYLRRWGSVSLGPSISYEKDSDDVSVGISVRVKIPWPSHSDDTIANTLDDRTLAGARYTAALHDLRTDITKQYNDMLVKWNSINNNKSLDMLEIEIGGELGNFTVHEYVDIIGKLFNQEYRMVDEISKYKMSGIILDSLLK